MCNHKERSSVRDKNYREKLTIISWMISQKKSMKSEERIPRVFHNNLSD